MTNELNFEFCVLNPQNCTNDFFFEKYSQNFGAPNLNQLTYQEHAMMRMSRML